MKNFTKVGNLEYKKNKAQIEKVALHLMSTANLLDIAHNAHIRLRYL